MKLNKTPILNRYTSLPVLIDMLSRQRIVLLTPGSWEDRNDAHFIESYKTTKKLSSVLAICFTSRSETFHHWKIFSGGSSGVCIQFDKARLLHSFQKVAGVKSKEVTYSLLRTVKEMRPKLEEWPFLKRYAFSDEGEFRIIYESEAESIEAKEIPFSVDSIQKITLSPWMPPSVAESVEKLLQNMHGCADLVINRSTLIDNTTWRSIVKPGDENEKDKRLRKIDQNRNEATVRY